MSEPTSNRRKNDWENKVHTWGIGLIVVGLVGLVVPSFGLQLYRLRALGEAQWVVLVVAVVAGCAAVLWSNRRQPRWGGMIAGGALAAMLLFAYLSFWRHGVGSIPGEHFATNSNGTTVAGELKTLHVVFEDVATPNDFGLLWELMKDCLPSATHHRTKLVQSPVSGTGKMVVSEQEFAFGPVPRVDELLSRIRFGKAKLQAADKLVIRVKYPLPSPAEAIQRRLEYGLDELRSDDARRQETAFRLFESLDPLARREEVAAQLVSILARPNPSGGAATCLIKWGLPLHASELAALLAKEGTNQEELLRVLEVLSPDDAIREAVALLPTNASLAERTLTQLGVRAEGAVVAALTHPDPKARVAACRILLLIGTAASLESLEKLHADSDSEVANTARRASEVIRQRGKK